MARILPDGSTFSEKEFAVVRKRALAVYDHRCVICGQELDANAPPHTKVSIEMDHILSLKRGGRPYEIDNLQILCHPCNRKKGAKTMEELSAKPIKNPFPISNAW